MDSHFEFRCDFYWCEISNTEFKQIKQRIQFYRMNQNDSINDQYQTEM